MHETIEIKTIEQARALLDDWMVAYRELRREHARLGERCFKAETDLEIAEKFLRHIDPFLPEWLQDEKLRAQSPGLYAALAGQQLHCATLSVPNEPEPALAEWNPFA